MNNSRRVGTLTAGIVLVVFGVLFLLRNFVSNINYRFIFACWPVILILLGAETLFSRLTDEQQRLRYDGAAVFLVLVMAGFSMVMAVCHWIVIFLGYNIIRKI